MASTARVLDHQDSPHVEAGLDGYDVHAPLAAVPADQEGELQRLMEDAVAIRDWLRSEQQATEDRRKYSESLHRHFVEQGYYRILLPKRLGGLELGLASFWQIVAELARGCPSTAWCYALPATSALRVCSNYPMSVQEGILSQIGDPYLIGPGSGQAFGVVVEEAPLGYVISGTWRYSSGAPYSNIFLPRLTLPATGRRATPAKAWALIPRADYEVIDDWGAMIGMKGSGSNSIRLDRVFVPERRISVAPAENDVQGLLEGYREFRNPLYNGPFNAYASGIIAAVLTGLGYAAIDEYEQLIGKSKLPHSPAGEFKANHPDWQRVLGTALARVDTAYAALVRNGQVFEANALLAAKGISPFSNAKTFRHFNSYQLIQDEIWQTVESLAKTAGSTASTDGQRMQRYFRDAWAAVSRTSQLQFFAADTAALHLESHSGRSSGRKPLFVD